MVQPTVDVSTLNSQASLNKIEALASHRHTEKEIDKVAGEFQTMCYTHLVKMMFSTTEDSPLWGNTHAAGILRSMFIDAVANAGGAESLNIRGSIKKSLYKNMGIENPPLKDIEAGQQLEIEEKIDVLL